METEFVYLAGVTVCLEHSPGLSLFCGWYCIAFFLVLWRTTSIFFKWISWISLFFEWFAWYIFVNRVFHRLFPLFPPFELNFVSWLGYRLDCYWMLAWVIFISLGVKNLDHGLVAANNDMNFFLNKWPGLLFVSNLGYVSSISLICFMQTDFYLFFNLTGFLEILFVFNSHMCYLYFFAVMYNFLCRFAVNDLIFFFYI